jgi:lysophospholipase L1-like esterase
MSDLKFSQMAGVGAITGNELLPLVQSGGNVKANLNQLKRWASTLGNPSAIYNGALPPNDFFGWAEFSGYHTLVGKTISLGSNSFPQLDQNSAIYPINPLNSLACDYELELIFKAFNGLKLGLGTIGNQALSPVSSVGYATFSTTPATSGIILDNSIIGSDYDNTSLGFNYQDGDLCKLTYRQDNEKYVVVLENLINNTKVEIGEINPYGDFTITQDFQSTSGQVCISHCSGQFEILSFNYVELFTSSICFVGNSITEGYGSGTSNDFIQQLESIYGIKFKKYAKAGVTSTEIKNNLRHIIAGNFNTVVLNGIYYNDGFAGISIAQTKANITSIITSLKAANTKVILCTTPYNAYASNHNTIRDWMIATYSTLPMIRIDLAINSTNFTTLTADGAHPNTDGYYEIASLFVIYFDNNPFVHQYEYGNIVYNKDITQIPVGMWQVLKNLPDGKVFIAANDAGVIKKVELL